MRLPLGGRGHGGLIGVGHSQPDPHTSRAMTWHCAEDEERAALPRDEPDIAALPPREALFKPRAGCVFERRWHGTDGERLPVRDDLDRVWQGPGLVLGMGGKRPPPPHPRQEVAAAGT